MRLLFTVADTFAISGRGLVLAPGAALADHSAIQPGVQLELRRPDGSSIIAAVAGLEFLRPALTGRTLFTVELEKADVPVGTEVWLLDGAIQ